MVRVTLNDLSRVPVERLAQLLLEWAAEDHRLLGRLQATLSRSNDAGEGRPSPGLDGGMEIIGRSAAMQQVATLIDRYASTDEPVLITGESGTGKELAARAIHRKSQRKDGPFVAVNCAALPPSLVASELFGYEKGAFTGAQARTKGQIEHADSGTLFLDEIGDMPVELQGHLLRFLQEGQIVRVGGRQTIDVNVRIVSATNVRLIQAIAEGRFREDLYYRLNTFMVLLPPLRERPDDIEPLALHFLEEAARLFNRHVTGFTPEAVDALRRYAWPGNIRELIAVIRRTVVGSNGPVIHPSDLTGLTPSDYSPQMTGPTMRPNPGSEDERQKLLATLARTHENVTETARALNVSRVTLYRMLRRHGIQLNRGYKVTPGWKEADSSFPNQLGPSSG